MDWTYVAVGLAAGVSYSSPKLFRALVIFALAHYAGLIF